MSSPYLGIAHIAQSQDQPEVTANAAVDSLDTAMNAQEIIELADADPAITLTQAQMASGIALKFTGALTANRDVIVQNNWRIFAVINATSGGYSINVKTPISGPGVLVSPAMGYVFLYCDGTNVFEVQAACSGSGSLPIPTEISLAPGAAGNFQVAHGRCVTPRYVGPPQMTSSGEIYFQATRYDALNIYLVASDASVTGIIQVWA